MAVQFVKAYGPIDRQLGSFSLSAFRTHDLVPFPASLSSLLSQQYDRAKVAVANLASKSFFAGESSGFTIARTIGVFFVMNGPDYS